jgi:uncharacterized protein
MNDPPTSGTPEALPESLRRGLDMDADLREDCMVDHDTIREFAGRLAREFAPERIILFGSYAAGSRRPDADVDLFVVMPLEGAGVGRSVEILGRLSPPFAVGLVVRTPEAVRWRLRQTDFFVDDVVLRGRVLYEADHR